LMFAIAIDSLPAPGGSCCNVEQVAEIGPWHLTTVVPKPNKPMSEGNRLSVREQRLFHR